jgi:oligopeptide/dipeptide ABC transporter ATP-binding protein
MNALVEVHDLTVQYPVSRTKNVVAVNEVSISLEAGSILGLVGESGCGKSSLGRAIAGIRPPTSGRIRVDGRELGDSRQRSDARLVQMVFQDPSSALNPKMTIGSMITELLLVHDLVRDRSAARLRAEELMASVELPTSVLDRRPEALSGGQRQRVGIARALALEPKVLIADEAVAALDTIVKASIVALLARLRDELGLSILFISHDLGVVKRLCDEIAVMYLGRIVERRRTQDLFSSPRHPYTAALLAARPHIGQRLDVSMPPALAGDPPSPMDLGEGCAFASRCHRVQDVCRDVAPARVLGSDREMVSCHFPLTDD